jgi:RimJ/RimL family protein N-acetyltransferase
MVDSSSPWDDWGVRDAPAPAELGRMVVELDGVAVGDVSWHSVWYGPNSGSRARNIGISIAASVRGQGVGSRAQRLLVEHLFATTDAVRVEASTDVANVAEQRALEKAGFVREGVLRSAQARADGHHDLVSYSFLRSDLR